MLLVMGGSVVVVVTTDHDAPFGGGWVFERVAEDAWTDKCVTHG